MEPAVSAALDFKAMLEAALRGPSFPCMSTLIFWRIFQIALFYKLAFDLVFKNSVEEKAVLLVVLNGD